MEKDKRTHVVALAALLIAVLGLSLGFAAFTTTLTIKSSADVAPNSDTFNIEFSKDDTDPTDPNEDPIVPVVEPDGSGATADNAEIDNSGDNPILKGLHATFTEPGQKATYSLYVTNPGEYAAYLKSIIYENVSGKSDSKICTAGTGATNTLVQAACTGISVKVSVGSINATGSMPNITGHNLPKAGSEPVIVTIEYASGSDRADGPFHVDFGDIVLTYSSID